MAVNVPITVWQGQDQAEYSNDGVYNIVDSLGNFLVDPSGVFIVDTGVIFTLFPVTIWSEDDGQ